METYSGDMDLIQLTEISDGTMSIEELMTISECNVGSMVDIAQYKHTMKKHLATFGETKRMMYLDNSKDIPSYVEVQSPTESTIVINQEMLFYIFCEDSAFIGKLIKQIDSLPEDMVLNVIIEMNVTDLNFLIMEAGLFVSNLLKHAKCKKIFNFGSQASIADLMIAMCCDSIYVSDFASVSITKADAGETISRYVIPVYRFIIRSTYKHWTDHGLFTPEEIVGLFGSEADNSIQLLSAEIKQRLKNRLT